MSRTFSGTALFVLVLFSSVLPAQTHAAKEVTVEPRLSPSQIVNGAPDAISFVLVNLGDHEVRVPPVSPCIGIYTGRLKLRLQFSPVTPTGTGKGGGCGSGEPHMPILDQVKSWRRLQPGQSFTATYKRTELFVFEQAPGDYDFWGEYEPPALTAEEVATVQHAGIDFLRESLTSAHLRFKRPE